MAPLKLATLFAVSKRLRARQNRSIVHVGVGVARTGADVSLVIRNGSVFTKKYCALFCFPLLYRLLSRLRRLDRHRLAGQYASRYGKHRASLLPTRRCRTEGDRRAGADSSPSPTWPRSGRVSRATCDGPTLDFLLLPPPLFGENPLLVLALGCRTAFLGTVA